MQNSSRETFLLTPFAAFPFDVPCSFSEGKAWKNVVHQRRLCFSIPALPGKTKQNRPPSPISFLPPTFLQNVYINTSPSSYLQTDLGPRDIRGRKEFDPGSPSLSLSLYLFPKCTTVALLSVCDTVNIFFKKKSCIYFVSLCTNSTLVLLFWFFSKNSFIALLGC